MSADAFFRMGSSHSICQDYAIAGLCDGLPYAIVSDGCSGVWVDGEGRTWQPDSARGAPFTDWGARLLALSTLERLRPISEGCFSSRDVIFAAAARARHLGLHESSLDATLLVAVATEEGGVQVVTTADGVVVWRELSGRIRYESVRFARGMPRYLSYYLDPDRHARLFEEQGQSDDLLAGTLEVTSNVWTPREGWGPQLLRQVSFTDSTSYTRPLYLSSKPGEFPPVDVVALFSDGVESFRDADLNPVPLETVLVELMSLKNLHGQFVTRRCKKFLEKTCAERGWRHEDDFSMAAVAFEESPPASAPASDLGLRTSGSGSGGEGS